LNEGNCGGADGMIKWERVRWWRWVERRTLWKATHNWGSGFAPHASTGEVEPAAREERFLSGAEGDFFVGAQGLAEYLDANQQGWVVKLKVLVSELDYTEFTVAIKMGRAPPDSSAGAAGANCLRHHAGQMVIARAGTAGGWIWAPMWMSGRVQPDHSTIGKFIQLHAELLSEQFFTTLVKQLVGKLHLSAARWAWTYRDRGAASHYRMLRAEALREAALSEQAERMLAERQAARELAGPPVRRRCSRRKSRGGGAADQAWARTPKLQNRRRCATKVGW